MIYRSIILLLCIVFIKISYAQNSIQVKSEIEKVTVFINASEIQRTAKCNIKNGLNIIKLSNLSKYLQSQSIQLKTGLDVDVLSISTESDYLSQEEINPKIVLIRDSIKKINSKLHILQNEIKAYNAEKSLLSKNEYLGSDNSSLSVEEIKKAAEFYRIRTLEIENAITQIHTKTAVYNAELKKFTQQVNTLNYANDIERKSIILKIKSSKAGLLNIDFKYVVYNSGWKPFYDIKSQKINTPITLIYKAKVLNNTGVDWENVDLTVSTADPTLNNSKPHLNTWTLTYSSSAYDGYFDKEYTGAYRNVMTDSVGMHTAAGNTVMVSSELCSEFIISQKYTIPTNTKPTIVEVAKHSLEAIYSYIAIPKVDKDAFLLAQITGWEKLKLIDGDASIYFNDTYVGKSRIQTRLVDDTLSFSLGRDKHVLITRSKKEDFTEKKLIGSTKAERFLYEIKIKNNKTEPIKIELKDQVPVSQLDDIKVEVLDISNGELNEQNGKVTWYCNVNPGEVKVYKLSFSVKYPKNNRVNVHQYRSIQCPSF